MEGETEKVFYHEYLASLCRSRGFILSKDEDSQEDMYEIDLGDGEKAIVMLWASNSVSQMVSGSIWFRRACAASYPEVEWTAFLCYDTDEYNSRITRFHEGDWSELRKDIDDSALKVVDMAAEADIEDIMLCDYGSVLEFLGLPADTPLPNGNKGKTKLKKLHRMVAPNVAYHEGARARSLIRSLNMDEIKRNTSIPLDEIDKALGNRM